MDEARERQLKKGRIKIFDDLVKLWDEEGQDPDAVDWLAWAQEFRNGVEQAEAERDKANLRAKNFEREIREQVDGWPQDEVEEWIEKLANQPDKPMDAPSV